MRPAQSCLPSRFAIVTHVLLFFGYCAWMCSHSRRDDRRSSRRSRRRSHSRSRSPGYGYSRRGRDNRDYRQYDRRGLPRNSRRAQKADRSPSTESQKARAHTRDARTIFVSQLVRKATEKDIKRYFEQVGKVRHVNLITDRSGASKGIAYVEFKHLETVPVRVLTSLVCDYASS